MWLFELNPDIFVPSRCFRPRTPPPRFKVHATILIVPDVLIAHAALNLIWYAIRTERSSLAVLVSAVISILIPLWAGAKRRGSYLRLCASYPPRLCTSICPVCIKAGKHKERDVTFIGGYNGFRGHYLASTGPIKCNRGSGNLVGINSDDNPGRTDVCRSVISFGLRTFRKPRLIDVMFPENVINM